MHIVNYWFFKAETTFQAGNYSFPFVFNLPANLPASVTETHGNIKYQVITTIDRPWAPDYSAKRNFFIYSYTNLNDMPSLKVLSLIITVLLDILISIL